MADMFHTLLVANRGEIACRVLRTARRLGIETVAVYSEADSRALHVKLADISVFIGAAPASESYLSSTAIIDAAKHTGAQAIHPGYGFLSENAEFAERCREAGITFVGPSPEVIRAMGEKQSAIKLMQDAGVRTLPSSAQDERSDAQLLAAAERIGYPVIVKPNAGGGGKGMHIVANAADLADALDSARREAASAFDDQRLMIEKYLPDARHVEVQVFADRSGNVVHLFERDCSVQRRHQKILEETPAPSLSAALRDGLFSAAVQATSAIDYLGAGTVEFLVGGDAYYFLEMNTRLQVEHPVTELTTGQDLVEWQLRVAAGEALPLTQADIVQDGHAIEARVYAEEPERDFLPSTGEIDYLRLPATDSFVRIDSGIQTGDGITVHYDPLLMKISCHAQTRTAANALLCQALHDTEITGVKTNLWVLGSLLNDKRYKEARLSTSLLESHLIEYASRAPAMHRTLRLLGVLYLVEERLFQYSTTASESNSPWSYSRPWRLNGSCRETVRVADNDSIEEVTVIHGADNYVLRDGSGQVSACVDTCADGFIDARIDGKKLRARVQRKQNQIVVRSHDAQLSFRVHLTDGSAAPSSTQTDGLTAPLPGTVIKVMVVPGQHVDKGAALLVIEAMKMEHTVRAPEAGVIEKILYGAGEQVLEDTELVVLCADA
jgi:3-methylcrotonyl-CoA carboxylase alpha subunit